MRKLALAGVYLVVVASGSTAVWQVISSAGTQIYAKSPVEATMPSAPTPTGSDAPTKPSPSVSPEGGTTSTLSAKPSPHPKPTTKPTTKPKPIAQTRIWSGQPGTVVSQCSGSLITLKGANPNSGWHVEVERSPREFTVKFDQGDGGREVEVTSKCSGGAPVFEVSNDN